MIDAATLSDNLMRFYLIVAIALLAIAIFVSLPSRTLKVEEVNSKNPAKLTRERKRLSCFLRDGA